MGKLTPSQRAYLEVMPDWSVAFEVLQRLGRARTHQSYGQVQAMLDKLFLADLIDYSPTQNTFRITPNGRQALKAPDHG